MQKIKIGMVGGGSGAFIGAVHRKAFFLDNQFELVCGAFSSNPERSMQTGTELGLDSKRVYANFDDMMRSEASLPAGERMQVVSIVTPNYVHFAPAKLAMENGFDVIIDKPLAFSVDEALELKRVAESAGRILALTHTYTGYPMIKEAKARVAAGELGKIRKIFVEYPQGWLSTFLEADGNKQASWRTDPSKSGQGGAVGDIGTHAANLAEYVSGLRIQEICAEVNIVVEGRKLDDDAAALLRFENNVSGVLVATQVAAGEENNLRIRVYGESGGLEWAHSDPNSLVYKPLDKPAQILRAGTGYLSAVAVKNTRLPAGHPEGYLEAFANIYLAFAEAVRDKQKGITNPDYDYDFPGVDDGVRGMVFVRTMIESAQSDKKWTPFKV
ncbi:MAG: Gfo/Idh/MocA family oxidoreductase [Balneolales bacterium]|nr:Gfo/Idh/MocA family oxidoreductase [Balneolales bacterium]